MKHLIRLLFLSALLSAQAANKPNIVLIMADDMGYECLAVNRSEDYNTPNLDRLAAEGVRFEQCFANPLCTPSRVKIMTGLYNKRNFTKFAVLDRSQTTFANLLQKEGYRTAIAGKWQLGREPDAAQHFGFDESCLWQHFRGRTREGTDFDTRFPNPQLEINGKAVDFNNGEYGPDVCADFICDFIETNKDQSFLAYYPMILTHCPFDATPDSERWDPASLGSPEYKGPGGDAPEAYGIQKENFADMVQYADKLVGRIVAKLDELGIRENTLIIFTGDNGTDRPIRTQFNGVEVVGGKGANRDTGTRVPLIVNWPARIQPAVQATELVEFSDFLPTLCEVAGAPLPENYPGDGLSLWPVLSGTGSRNKEYVYSWYFRHTTWVRNVHFGVLRNRTLQNDTFQKFSGHFSQETVDLNSAPEPEQAVFKQLKQVMDDMATVDSLFVDPKTKKQKAATNKEPVQKTAAPKSNPGKLSVQPGAATSRGTRYEAEAGKVSGGAQPRDVSDASGGVLLAGMKGRPVRNNYE